MVQLNKTAFQQFILTGFQVVQLTLAGSLFSQKHTSVSLSPQGRLWEMDLDLDNRWPTGFQRKDRLPNGPGPCDCGAIYLRPQPHPSPRQVRPSCVKPPVGPGKNRVKRVKTGQRWEKQVKDGKNRSKMGKLNYMSAFSIMLIYIYQNIYIFVKLCATYALQRRMALVECSSIIM